MRLAGRICYGIAAALGLISLGMEWQNRRQVAQSRGLFPQPQSHAGMLVAIWAGMAAITGKVIEDTVERQPFVAGAPERQARASLGSFGAFMPRQAQRATTLRSDFDLGDQYVEPRLNSQPYATVH